ncbi:MAG: histidine kinase [Clostridia bacterium BRH_c25]|nr:MAG: histidine kinase [Clostridia bacterium BRH_c25]
MKTEFFSNISHELKTPLNVILATIQLLKSQKNQAYLGMKENKYLKIMQQNCYRLLRLVNNLIDITKIDSNYYEIRLQNYDIISLVEGITMSVAEYAMDKGITILFDTNTEEKVMSCDPDQIERIILNLLSNAIKFTPKGGNIWVTIFDQGEKIEIAIKDTGIGIPRDKQECIFNRFQQVDKSLARQSEGSGIGLSLVKALVEKHNGKITLNSELDKGSEFIIEIPCNILIGLESKSSIQQNHSDHNYVERISVEFSDIYS